MPSDVISRLLKRRRVTAANSPAHTWKPTSLAPLPAPSLRQKVVTWAHWGVAHEPQIGYSMGGDRDDWLHTKPKNTLPLTTDCSGFATLCYCLAGADDPNGLDYRVLGYTGTLLEHGKRVTVAKVRPGDLAVFGCKTYPKGHHVVVVTAVKTRTLAGIMSVSHGQQKGPFEITIADEAKYQPDGAKGVVFLSFLP